MNNKSELIGICKAGTIALKDDQDVCRSALLLYTVVVSVWVVFAGAHVDRESGIYASFLLDSARVSHNARRSPAASGVESTPGQTRDSEAMPGRGRDWPEWAQPVVTGLDGLRHDIPGSRNRRSVVTSSEISSIPKFRQFGGAIIAYSPRRETTVQRISYQSTQHHRRHQHHHHHHHLLLLLLLLHRHHRRRRHIDYGTA